MKPQHAQPTNGDRVIESFQQTMQAFLEVQRSTMLAYLAGPRRSRSSACAAVHARSRGPGLEPRASVSAAASARSAREPDGRSSRAIDRPGQRSSAPDESASAPPVTRRIARSPSNGKPHATMRHPRPVPGAGPRQRSPPGCSRPCAIGPAIRSRRWGSTSIWKPTWASIRSSESRSWARCAMNSRCLKGLSDSAEAMDALARARTLGVIVDRMTALAEQANGRPGRLGSRLLTPAAGASTGSNGKPHETDAQRRLLEPSMLRCPSTVSASCPAAGS